ncbi:hypothetical protein LJK88_41210 [Paenibacillus sp. P26]|nr:hypothetical protein LJK88_41210 [Paenibacillus sp. P26]
MMTGTLAAAFLLGGAGPLGSQAFAAASADNGTAQNTVAAEAQANMNQNPGVPGRGQRPGDRGFRGGDLAQETATLLGVDLSTVTSDLQQGKTLAEIAQAKGLAEEDFLQKACRREEQVYRRCTQLRTNHAGSGG